MGLEDRMAALEALIDTLEEKRKLLRNEVLALQFVLLKLLPVISTAPRDETEQALALAQDHASVVLPALQYDADDVLNVLASIHSLRSELLGESEYEPTGALH